MAEPGNREELLEALSEQERRLARAARPLIEANEEGLRKLTVKRIGTSTLTSPDPKMAGKSKEAEEALERAILKEMRIPTEGSHSEIILNLSGDDTKWRAFCRLRSSAIRNAEMIWGNASQVARM